MRSKMTLIAVCLISFITTISASASIPSSSFRAAIEDADLVVPDAIPFREKIERHRTIVLKIQSVADTIDKELKAAQAADSLSKYKVAAEELGRVAKYAAPYDAASLQAKQLKNNGRVLKDADTGTVCNGAGECSNVDPMTALFMIVIGALTDELNKEKPFDPNTNDLVKFLIQPAGGPTSDFVKIRSIVIPQDDNGEIARILRDPVKRPLEIVQSVRDAVIPPQDNGEIAKIIRDPVQCTVGRLFGGCK